MPYFPTEPANVRRWLKVVERNIVRDDARWWARGNGGSYIPLTDALTARLGTPSVAENAVYLHEVVDALECMSGSEQAAWFLNAVEGTHSAYDRLKVHRMRKRLREKME